MTHCTRACRVCYIACSFTVLGCALLRMCVVCVLRCKYFSHFPARYVLCVCAYGYARGVSRVVAGSFYFSCITLLHMRVACVLCVACSFCVSALHAPRVRVAYGASRVCCCVFLCYALRIHIQCACFCAVCACVFKTCCSIRTPSRHTVWWFSVDAILAVNAGVCLSI